ncbi:MAG: glycoside hydrolase family 43 protein [Lachnospiraceae bacterium]|jgi:arabinan endo-1,5-alpha-L-arabinosidase|nr:glycoside hydrolase family 43 protein [Lachnospiraceae bacterium]
MKKAVYLVLAAMAALLTCACGSGAAKAEMTADEIKATKTTWSAGASVHDPSILQVGENYYIFGSHMESAKSTDLKSWTTFSTGVDAKNKLFTNLFDADLKAFSYVGKNEDNWYSVWAPDVIYNKTMGKYMMYFCTSSTYKKSSLCFATADAPEGPYTFKDIILDSGFTYQTVKQTDFYKYHDKKELKNYLDGSDYDNLLWPNCIDPTVFYDRDGKMWMCYGSWSGGIFLLQIDESTGYPIHPAEDADNEVDAYYGKHLLGGGHNSIEGPYILYDPSTDYYYQFVSYGQLQAKGGYQIRLFRSKEVDGPYEDTEGQTLGTVVDHSTYGLKMMGNYTFPDMMDTYMAPGGQSAFIDSESGKMYVVYHQRFKNGTEFHEPRVHQLFANKEGWLVAAPFATSGETLNEKGYTAKYAAGTYYLVDHGTDISRKVHKCETVTLAADGTVSGDESGTWALEKGTPYVTITYGGNTFSGVMVEMTDESGNDTMCLTAAGTNNETVWGVHYFGKQK